MAYIYKIVNDINDKVYVGKTQWSLEKRFNEHIWDAKRPTEQHRPLYRAMQKYGFSHFSIELIEETNCPDEREQYWIQYYDSFHYGYNATLGGEGKRYCDYNKIVELYNQGKTILEISQILNYDPATCRVALSEAGISYEERKSRGRQKLRKPVTLSDPITNEILYHFSSIDEACRFLSKTHNGALGKACRENRVMYGYRWGFDKK